MKISILDALLDQKNIEDAQVENVLIGVHWTAIVSKHCGLSSTLTGDGLHGHNPLEGPGTLHQKSALELCKWLRSENQLAASVGMAALNSLLPVDTKRSVEINAANILAAKGQRKNIAIVGHFPFVDKIKQVASHCWVIEKKPYGEDLPEGSASIYLPQSDVVAITATAIINHTLDKLLEWIKPGAFVMILGPSTPLTPLWFDYGISVYSGTQVIDLASALMTIQQGAAFPQVKGVRLLSFAKDPDDLLNS